MNLQGIIDQIAGQADDFLGDAANRKEARAGIAELLTADYPALSGADRLKVTEAVMKILDDEGFFEAGAGGDSWQDGEQAVEDN